MTIEAQDKASSVIKKATETAKEGAARIIEAEGQISAATKTAARLKQEQLTLSQKMKFSIQREAAAGDKLATALVNEREELAKVERKLRAAIKAGDLESEALAKQTVELRKNVQKLEEKQQSEGKGAITSAQFAKGLAAAGVAAAAAAAGAFLVSKKVSEAGDAMIKASQRLNLTTDEFQKLDYAMQISGTSIEKQKGALTRFAKTARDASAGVKQAESSFKLLGVSVKNNDGTFKGTNELLMEVSDAFKNMPPSVEKTAVSMDLFGRSGAQLSQFLNLGSEGVKNLGLEAVALGGVMSEQAAKGGEEFVDALTRMQTASGAITRNLGEEFQPMFTRVMNQAAESIGRLRKVYAPVFQGLVDFAIQAGQLIVPALTFMAQAFVGVATTVQLAWNGLLHVLNKVAGGILDNINSLIGAMNRVLPASKQIEQWMNPFKSTADSIANDMSNIVTASAATMEEIEKLGDAILGNSDTRLTSSVPSIEAETRALVEQNEAVRNLRKEEDARIDKWLSDRDKMRQQNLRLQESIAVAADQAKQKQIQEAESFAKKWTAAGATAGQAVVAAFFAGETAAEGFKEAGKEAATQMIDILQKAAVSAIMGHAATGAAGAASSQAAVPIVGPALAAAAATAMFAVISGYVSTFNKGGIVPGVGSTDSQMAMLTPGEIVLPKGLSAMLLDVVGRRGSGAMNQGGVVQNGGVGGVVVNFNENSITPRTPAELDRFVRDRLVPTMQRLRRQGVAI